ncbi:MAG: alpha/beta hydrolase [Bradyrhizobium sp.]|uniref:alpha/beta hydrolase n=1 Tax=Bradyrhizobium sp. TaxID=376 RepID=UPI003D131AA6
MSASEQPVADAVESAIERIRSVYRSWNRETSATQMRRDWDAAFAACTIPVSRQEIIAGGVPAEWIVPSGAPTDRVIVYFHGGGFRIGSIASHLDLIARIAAASGFRTLAIDYRLAPEHRFPAALEDAVAALEWLGGQGYDAAHIALAGDSAGGNLVLASMLELRRRGRELPVAAALMSPWTDLAATGASYETRAKGDPIHQRSMILALAKNYLGEDGDPRDPLVSPLYADLAGLPPLLIQAGDLETVRDDSTMLAERASAAGVEVELQVWDGMIHVFQMFPEIPQAGEAVAAVAAFLRRHLGTRPKGQDR